MQRVVVKGSIARGEETLDSDLDLLIEFRPPEGPPFGFFGLIELEEELGRRAGRPVELAFSDSLKPRIRPTVEAEQVVLYEAA